MFSSNQLIFGITVSALLCPPVLANQDWIGVECTYTPTAQKDKIQINTSETVDGDTTISETKDSAPEYTFKFYINEKNQVVKDVNKNDMIASFNKHKIFAEQKSNHQKIFKFMLSRNGYKTSTLYIQSGNDIPSHYSAECSSFNLDADDLYPNRAYPSSNRGF